jgi:hypothetical protein
MECCYVEAFNATHPGHAAPPEVQYAAPPWHAALPGHAAPFWACCFPWACCSPRCMLVNSHDQKTFLHYFLWCIMVHALIVLHKRLYCSIYESCYTVNDDIKIGKIVTKIINNSILGMLLPPGLAAPTVERPPLRPINSKQVLLLIIILNFPKKVTVWGGKISSQISIERLLISSPPSKRTLQQKKVIIFGKFSFSRF